ncbi:MAG: hypothetical protein WCI92_01145 [Bacteroidota bacterium]
MKKRIVVSLMIILVVLASCQPPVTFDKPQPADAKALNGFPKRIQGKYLSSRDSSVLKITPNSLVRIYDYNQKIHISQLDSNQQLIGDTLFDLNTNKGMAVIMEGDLLVQHIKASDTIFTINALNVLKKFKGYYFINNLIPPETWQVQKIELSRGILALSGINKTEDIAQLKTLTETTQDTMPYVFSPTKQEFKKFINNEGFRDSEIFLKIKE